MNYKKLSIDAYIKELSSINAVPGGGSATALVGVSSISLSLMVVSILLPKLDSNLSKQAKDIQSDLNLLKRSVSKVINDDARLYAKVISAYRLSEKTKNKREKIQAALYASYESMRNLAVDLCSLRRLNKEISLFAKGSIANDLKVSNNFLKAAFLSACQTAEINIDYFVEDVSGLKARDELKKIKDVFKKC